MLASYRRGREGCVAAARKLFSVLVSTGWRRGGMRPAAREAASKQPSEAEAS